MREILFTEQKRGVDKLRIVSLIVFTLLIPVLCVAQTHKQEEIDIAYEKCVALDTTCGSVGNCAFVAYGKWERQMTLTYDKLMKELKKADEKTALRKAQAAWVAYKDATFASYDFMFNLPGDKWCLLRHEARVDVVRRRTLELRDYYEYLKKRK